MKKTIFGLTALFLSAFAGSAAAQPTVAPLIAGTYVYDLPASADKYLFMSGPAPGASWPGGVIHWSYNDTNRPLAVPKATALGQLQASMAKWHASGCNVQFVYDGETAQPIGGNSVNVVGWVTGDPALVQPTTGITYVSWDGSNHYVHSDMKLNADYVAAFTSATGFDATATHEFGHMLGLNHSDVEGQVMSGPPTSHYDGMYTLQSDDIAGCIALYGGSGGPPLGPDVTAPTVPAGLAASSVTQTTLTLTWNASTDPTVGGATTSGVANYKIYVGGALLGTVNGAGANVSGLNPGTPYSFTVSACDSASNCSAQSAALVVTTTGAAPPPPDTQAPTVPTGLVATAASSSQINLAWNASTDNVGVTSYQVFQSGVSLGSVGSPSAQVTGLAASTMYSFTVSACDAAGNCSAQSAPASATTPAGGPPPPPPSGDTQPPTTPTGLHATPISTTEIDLAWNASTDNVGVTGYQVFKDGFSLGTVGSPSAQVTGLLPGTSYIFRVQACDAAGNCSPQTAAVTASTLTSGTQTCSGSKPADEQQSVACPAGQTGAITQRRTYSCVGTTWTPSAWTTTSNTCTTSTAPPPYYKDGDYSDLWWVGPAEDGWGVTLSQHGDTIFLAWYIYDSSGKPLWVVMPGGTWNTAHDTYTGNLYIPNGSWFGAYDAAHFVANASVGTASVHFNSATAATLAYTVQGASGSKSITRQTFGTANSTPITNYTDIWWGGTAENGWGIVLAQQYHDIFAAWYTYDSAGKPTWLVMPGGMWTSTNTYTGALFRTSSVAVLGTSYTPSSLVITQAGTLTFTFSTANTATVTYTLDGITQTKQISRQPF